MDHRQTLRGPVIGALVAILSCSLMPLAAVAHVGESGHLHVPGDATTPTSSVWCVRFTQDPGAWRPDGETAVDPSLMSGTSIVFLDCADVLASHYTVESYADGQVSRTTVGEPVIGDLPSTTEAATGADVADGADVNDAEQAMTVNAWTQHQKRWLATGDKLGRQLTKVRTPEQARKALGALQRYLGAEMDWLKANKGRFELDTCVAQDKAQWERRVKEAQQSLNKTVTAMNRSSFAAMTTNIRQFGRAWTKVEQIYQIGMCDF